MDRGTWQATVHKVTESDMTEATSHTCTEVMFVGDFLEKNCLVEILMLSIQTTSRCY